MRKHLRSAVALLLCLLLATAGMGVLAADDITVKLRVEGISENLLYTDAVIAPGTSVYTMLLAQLQQNGIAYVDDNGYITSIGGEAAGAFGGWDGWIYYVNGQEAAVGMTDYVLQDGDSVLVCYSDAYGTPATLLPQVTAARNSAGIVTLTFAGTFTRYDENWNATTVTIGIDNADVMVDGTAYTTNAAGSVILSEADSAKDSVALQIQKADEQGRPLAIRFAPDFIFDLSGVTFTVPQFTDVADGMWYAEYVQQLAQLGVVSGDGNGSFRPTDHIKRAEVVKMLAVLAGADLSQRSETKLNDVPEGMWYTAYMQWAVDHGIVQPYFLQVRPMDDITRQELAVMLIRFNENVLQRDLPADQPAPTFTDAGQIASYAAESIYHLQKAGIVTGSGGAYRPLDGAQRCEVAKMLVLLAG